jgi:glutamyl-tRNA synthetase
VTGYLAWRAGLLDAPRPASPRELAERFDFARVRRGPVVLPEDVAQRLTRRQENR